MQLIDTNIGISWSTRYLYSTSSDDNIISIKILAQILNVKQSIALYMTFVYLLIQLNVVKGCPTYAEERKSYIYLHPLQVRANCSLTPDCWFIQFVDIFSINWHKCWVSGQQENTKICCIIPNKVTTFNCLLDQFLSQCYSLLSGMITPLFALLYLPTLLYSLWLCVQLTDVRITFSWPISQSESVFSNH